MIHCFYLTPDHLFMSFGCSLSQPSLPHSPHSHRDRGLLSRCFIFNPSKSRDGWRRDAHIRWLTHCSHPGPTRDTQRSRHLASAPAISHDGLDIVLSEQTPCRTATPDLAPRCKPYDGRSSRSGRDVRAQRRGRRRAVSFHYRRGFWHGHAGPAWRLGRIPL